MFPPTGPASPFDQSATVAGSTRFRRSAVSRGASPSAASDPLFTGWPLDCRPAPAVPKKSDNHGRRIWWRASTAGRVIFSADDSLWSPEGQHILFLGAEDDTKPVAEHYDWWVVPVDGGAPVATGALSALRSKGTAPVWREPGDWIEDSIVFAAATGQYATVLSTGLINQSRSRACVSPVIRGARRTAATDHRLRHGEDTAVCHAGIGWDRSTRPDRRPAHL